MIHHCTSCTARVARYGNDALCCICQPHKDCGLSKDGKELDSPQGVPDQNCSLHRGDIDNSSVEDEIVEMRERVEDIIAFMFGLKRYHIAPDSVAGQSVDEIISLLEEVDRKAREDELTKAHDQSLSTDSVFSYLTGRILELRRCSIKENHLGNVLQWVRFTGRNYTKQFYDVKTPNGIIFRGWWPNAGYMNGEGVRFGRDDNVQIRPTGRPTDLPMPVDKEEGANE